MISIPVHVADKARATTFQTMSAAPIAAMNLWTFLLRTFPASRHYRSMQRIDDHDLERYYLGLVTDEPELAVIEEHLLWCQPCLARMKETERYVDAIRAGAVLGNFDVDVRWKVYRDFRGGPSGSDE